MASTLSTTRYWVGKLLTRLFPRHPSAKAEPPSSVHRLSLQVPTLVTHGFREAATFSRPPERTFCREDGVLWAEYYIEDHKACINFPDLAAFYVSLDETRVDVVPLHGTSEASLQQLWHGQVLPMLYAARGHTVLHGCAVKIGERTACFLGRSGMGKSTMASSFAIAGYPFLTDDGLLLERVEGQGYEVHPSNAAVRLWRDSEEAVLPKNIEVAPPVQYTTKSRFVAGDELPHCNQTSQLSAIYVLAREGVSEPTIAPLRANEAMMEFTKHSFLLDARGESALRGHFERMSTLACEARSFRLDYPREYAQLPEVREAVLNHQYSLGSL